MNEERRQELIQHCEETIAKYKFAVENLEPNEDEADSYPETIAEFKLIISTHEIALAALKAQPVKLPNCVDDLHGIGPVMSADEVESAIRAAGYEVQE